MKIMKWTKHYCPKQYEILIIGINWLKSNCNTDLCQSVIDKFGQCIQLINLELLMFKEALDN